MLIGDVIRNIREHQAKNFGAYPNNVKVTQSQMKELEQEFNRERYLFPVDCKAPYYDGMKIMGVSVIVE